MSRVSRVLFVLSLVSLVAAPLALAEEIAYVDSERNVFIVDTEDPNNPFRLDPQGPTKSYPKQNITFNVTYVDVDTQNGIGFDDPQRGAEFRSRLNDVLTYVDSILDHTGSLDIMMERSINDAQSNTLASAGAGYPSGVAMLSNGFAFDRLTTGVKPQPGMPEIFSCVNFGVDWYAGTGTTPATEFDFFTVMLHEIGHGLGLAGLLNENGDSDLPGVFTMWDVLTQTGAMQDIVTAGGGAPAFVGMVADLTSDNLFFNGAMSVSSLGTRPPIFAPNPFQQGSSLSHFDDMRISQPALMGPASSPGQEVREFAPFELGTLQDIGYSVTGMDMMGTEQPTIGVSPAALNDVAAAGATETIAITNTGMGQLSWTAAASVDWITLSPTSGTGPGTLTVTIAENTTELADMGTITITDANATNSPVQIAVSQLGAGMMGTGQPTIGASPAALSNVAAAGATQSIAITNTGTGQLAWTASASVDWITLSPTSGTGPGTLTVTIAENFSDLPDTGTITITDANATNSPVQISVSQLGVSAPVPTGCGAGMFGAGSTSGGPKPADILLALGTVAGLLVAGRSRRVMRG